MRILNLSSSEDNENKQPDGRALIARPQLCSAGIVNSETRACKTTQMEWFWNGHTMERGLDKLIQRIGKSSSKINQAYYAHVERRLVGTNWSYQKGTYRPTTYRVSANR